MFLILISSFMAHRKRKRTCSFLLCSLLFSFLCVADLLNCETDMSSQFEYYSIFLKGVLLILISCFISAAVIKILETEDLTFLNNY